MSDETAAESTREGREECLEALYRLERAGMVTSWQALHNNPDLADIDTTATLLELVGRDEVSIADGLIGLRPQGRVIGRRIFRRHELVERLFRLLGLKRERAHREACRFEHIMILPGEVRAKAAEHGELPTAVALLGNGALPLTQGRCGVPYRLGMICGGHGARRKLEDMGVSRGTEILLCSRRRGGPVEIFVRGSRLALGHGVASKVLVIPATDRAGADVDPAADVAAPHRHWRHGGHHTHHRGYRGRNGR